MSEKALTQRLNALREKKLYPRAHENRLPISHPLLKGPRKNFLLAALKSFFLLQILFLALFSYLFGALFHQGNRVHELNVLFVDYDGGGRVGESFRDAYRGLKGNTFPTLVEREVGEFPRAEGLREDVCGIRSWAAVYIAPGASAKVEAAIAGQDAGYDKSDIAYYIWNEALYSAVIDSAISANLQALSNAARVAYSQGNWTGMDISTSSIQVFANPWTLTSKNIQPTTQGSRLIYNTLVIILILIQEFFYLGSINALYEAFNIYTRLNPHRIIMFRVGISAAYCLVGSLCVAGAIWAFRAEWHVNGAQFVLTWAALWIFAHLNFLTLDVFTVWLPAPFVPMALISWIVLNVTSILLPFELSSHFYRWGYAMPAHAVYLTLIDIWSGGCNPVLYYSLPVLFAYEISSFILSALGVHRRCHYAIVKQENDADAFQLKIDTAIKFEKTKLRERQELDQRVADGEVERMSEDGERASMAANREELENEIERETTRIRREQSKGSRVDFGPSFGFL